MILPKDVVGYKKIRDAQIIDLYANGGLTQTEIAKKFDLTQTRIASILRNNAKFIVNTVKDYEKVKRIHAMKRSLEKDVLPFASTKVEILRELRKEYEGDQQVSVISQFFTIRPPKNISNRLTEAISNPE